MDADILKHRHGSAPTRSNRSHRANDEKQKRKGPNAIGPSWSKRVNRGECKCLKRMAPQVGLEPTTLRLTGHSSTLDLERAHVINGSVRSTQENLELIARDVGNSIVGADQDFL
jgi:hypothetical protein